MPPAELQPSVASSPKAASNTAQCNLCNSGAWRLMMKRIVRIQANLSKWRRSYSAAVVAVSFDFEFGRKTTVLCSPSIAVNSSKREVARTRLLDPL
eukprot:7452077-Pyramimonas_sp.AAC.1